MEAEGAGGAGLAVKLGEETRTLSRAVEMGRLAKQSLEVPGVRGSSLGADVGPELSFLRTCSPHPDTGVIRTAGFSDQPYRTLLISIGL